MTIETPYAAGLLPGTPYHHVAVTTGSRQVHIAGQVALAADGTLIAPGDLAGQVAAALRNVALGLASAGAGFADVARLTFYVTAWSPDKMTAFLAGIDSVAAELGLASPMPPSSLIGVEMLFEPGVLVEIEATAVLD